MKIKFRRMFLCLGFMSILALTGCMKYLMNSSMERFNEKYSITEPIMPTDTQTSTIASTNTNTNTDNYSIEDTNYIGIRYEQLTPEQKITYDEICIGIENYSKEIYLSQKIYQEDLEKVYDAIMNTANVELISTTRKYDYKYDNITGEISKVCPNYSVSREERDRMVAEVQSVANEVVASVQGLDTFQTLKTFHDYIITHCDYQKTGENYSNAYGVFVEGKAICEGYSRAFKYLCNMVDIPCELVLGTANIDHMWNLVKINGNWYHIDVTWDDPENKGGDYISYTYFNVSDSQIFVNHTINDVPQFPSATATDMNYYRYYNVCAYTSEEVYNLIYGEIYKACLNDDKYVYLCMNDKSTFDTALETLQENDWYVMYNIVNNAYSTAESSKNPSDISCSYDSDMFTMTITLN